MSLWRVRFKFECERDGEHKCVQGKSHFAFALMEQEEIPSEFSAFNYVNSHLYYCSGMAEKHFLDTGHHHIEILEISKAI